jgi:mRNA interferase RelE/StbE
VHSSLSIEDLPNLPSELKKDLVKYQQVLSLNPHETRGIPSHNLTGELKGYRALEIDWNNVSYRLVYRIYEKPIPKRVVIVSFAEHDPAYEKVKTRK